MNVRVEALADRTNRSLTPIGKSKSDLRRTESFVKSSQGEGKLQGSASVANCIRALNLKTTELIAENLELKEKNKELMQKSAGSQELMRIIEGYKEKCIILEQSNNHFSQKLMKHTETLNSFESLRAEFILINKELTREIEKNQGLENKANQYQEEKAYLEEQLQELNCKLTDMARNAKGKINYFEETKLKEAQNTNRYLEGLLEKSQTELEEKRKTIESLKSTILDLENSLYETRLQTQKSELYIKEVTGVNDRLLRALKHKTSCKHRSATPDTLTVDLNKNSYTQAMQKSKYTD